MNTELVINLSGSRRSRSQWLRYRLSQLYYEEKEITAQEMEYLFYVIFDFAEADEEQLDKKMQNRLHTLNFILESRDVFMQQQDEVSKKKIFFYCGGIILPPHEYYGLKNDGQFICKPASSLYSVKRMEKKKYPEQRRVGVGYRDKGSARNIAKNGEMNWEYYSTKTDFREKTDFSLASLLVRGSQLQTEIDNEIEDSLFDF